MHLATVTRPLHQAEREVKAAGVQLWQRVPHPVRRLVGWVMGEEFFITSAALAFYALISIPPMALIGLWVASGVVSDGTLRHLGDGVSQSSPDSLQLDGVVRSLVDLATRLGWASALAALWPATAYGAALAKAFSVIAPGEQRSIRGWKGRLFGLVVVACLPLVVFAVLAVLFVVPRVVDANPLVVRAALGGAAVVVFALIVALVFSLYQLRDTSLADIAVGALAATGLQVLVTGGYLVYLVTFASFQRTYGSSGLSVVVLLGFWLLLSNACLLSSYRLMLRRCRRRREQAGEPREQGQDMTESRRSDVHHVTAR